MTKITLGKAHYIAIKKEDTVTITASGVAPNLGTSFQFNALPMLIYPPMLSFNFIDNGMAGMAIKQFDYSQSFEKIFSKSTHVSITDETGRQLIPITPGGFFPTNNIELSTLDKSGQDFCVYQILGRPGFLIAKNDDILIAIYYKVFGPDTYESCQEYINKGSISFSM